MIIGGGITLLTAIEGTAFLIKKFGKSNEPKPAVPVNNNSNVSTNNLVSKKNLNADVISNMAERVYNFANKMSNELGAPLSGNLTNSNETFKTVKQTCDNLNKVLEGINGSDIGETAKTIKKTCDNLNVVFAKAKDFDSIGVGEAVKRTFNNLNGILEVLHRKINDDNSAVKAGQFYDSLTEAIKELDTSANSQMCGDLSRHFEKLSFESDSDFSSESSETESDTDDEKDKYEEPSEKHSEELKKTKELDSKSQDQDSVTKLDDLDSSDSSNGSSDSDE